MSPDPRPDLDALSDADLLARLRRVFEVFDPAPPSRSVQTVDLLAQIDDDEPDA